MRFDDCGGDPAVSAVGGDGEGEPPDPGTGVESVTVRERLERENGRDPTLAEIAGGA